MRSPKEIAFRLRQELRNLSLATFPPKHATASETQITALPPPQAVADALRETQFAQDLTSIADQILAHRFSMLGMTLETGEEIEWRRDYVNGIVTDARYLRLVPYLDARRAGDHKIIWELNRHQHLVLLAQAFCITGRAAYLREIERQLQSWWQQNPYQRGINWTSALEVAFRAFSWIWLYHLVGGSIAGTLRKQLLESLYQHGHHIETNLSVYFSPNTHLLGEAVVLDALGALFPEFPAAKRWLRIGGDTVSREMLRQVRPDGSHFEQSTYYHVYALDMFLFHAIVSKPDASYLNGLAPMADFLQAAMGRERVLPFIGDDDGGRWFHPYGARDRFGRATLATCSTLLGRDEWTYRPEDLFVQAAWWLGRTKGSAEGTQRSRLFPDSGLALLESSSGRIAFDGGRFGPGRAGHSHSDSLSIVASAGAKRILVDSGTYTYVGDLQQRDAFRGSAAHNTIRVDGRDQAVPIGPFWWADPPDVALEHWESNEAEDTAIAECRSQGVVHRRCVRFLKPDLVFVLDWIDGGPGEHDVEQFWHLGEVTAVAHLHFASQPESFECWHSRVFGQKEPARCLVVRRRSRLPLTLAAAIDLTGTGRIAVEETSEGALFLLPDGTRVQIPWPKPTS